MDKVNLSTLTAWQRFKAECPIWAKRLIKWCIGVAGTATALVTAKATHIFEDVFPHLFWTVCHYLIAMGVAAGAVAKNTVDQDKLQAKADAQAQASTPEGSLTSTITQVAEAAAGETPVATTPVQNTPPAQG